MPNRNAGDDSSFEPKQLTGVNARYPQRSPSTTDSADKEKSYLPWCHRLATPKRYHLKRKRHLSEPKIKRGGNLLSKMSLMMFTCNVVSVFPSRKKRSEPSHPVDTRPGDVPSPTLRGPSYPMGVPWPWRAVSFATM